MNESLFQVLLALVGALLAIINIGIGVVLKHILAEQTGLRDMLRDMETQYFPRREFERYEELQSKRRHDLAERITAVEIRLGDWRAGK